MESDPSSGRASGGTVEPANRAEIAKARAQTPSPSGERYELHDPFYEVTYRSTSMKQIIAHADRLQASRFVAVGKDGSRTPIHRVGDQWERQPTLRPHPPTPDQEVDDTSSPQKSASKAAGRDAAAAAPAARTGARTARDEAEMARAAHYAELEAALLERYTIKRSVVTIDNVPMGRTEYRWRGDTNRIAFTETAFKLSTENDNPSVARSMVDVAESRDWKVLRISGTEVFKRQVWLEATVRGVRALGYQPTVADLQLVERERVERQHNRIEPAPDTSATPRADSAAPAAVKGTSGRGGGGRKAVLAALEAMLVERKVPEKQRAAVMAAAEQNLAQRLRNGEQHRVKVYDSQAPARNKEPMPTRDVSRVPAVERPFPQPAR